MKNRECYIQTGILLLAAAVQIVAILAASDAENPDRFMKTSLPVVLSIIWIKTVVLPLAGPSWTYVFAKNMKMMLFSNEYEFAVFQYKLFFLLLLFIAFLFQGKERGKQLLMMVSYCLLTLLSLLASLGDKVIYIDMFIGGRYFYVPGVILIIFIYSNIHFTRRTVRMAVSALSIVLITASLISGSIGYKPSIMLVANDSWSSWSEEVDKWEKDRSHILKVWPQYEDHQLGIKLPDPSQSR